MLRERKFSDIAEGNVPEPFYLQGSPERHCRLLTEAANGHVAELADALDLGSSGATRQSSSLCMPTNVKRRRKPNVSPVSIAAGVRFSGTEEPHFADLRSAKCGSSSVVEHRLAKARVASSNLVFRSSKTGAPARERRSAPRSFSDDISKEKADVTTSTLTRLAPTQVELEIPITAEDLSAAEERAFRKLVKNVRLPGFRPGKVPRKVFEQTYGAEAITREAMDDVVPQVYTKAIREHDLEPVDRPKMELLPDDEGKPAKIKATVEVRPEINLGEYKGISVTHEATPVTEEDVDRSLQSLAKDRATLVPVERPAQLGDVVTMDFEGKIDGVPFEGGTAQQQVAELDENRFIPGFASGIAGLSAGETKDVEAVFPEEYGQAELAGKTAVFTVTVHDVKQYELPAIDDEFAKSISDNETAQALRDDVRTRLEAIAKGRDRRTIGNLLMEKLLAAYDFPLPETLVEREVDHMMNDLAQTVSQQGTSLDEFLKQSGKTEDEVRSTYRSDAETRVKGTLVIEAIAKQENIVATPADIAEEVEALARQYGQPVDRIRQALGNNVVSLMDGIIRNKTLEFLIDSAQVS